MDVSSILRRKGTEVEKALPGTKVGDAARRLTAKGVGSLAIVDEGGNLLGVLAERDLVRALGEYGPSSWHLPVERVLESRPATCKPDDSLRAVMSVMTKRRARHLPVIAGEALVGLVSIGDVVKAQLEDLEREVGVLRDYVRARP